MQGFIKLTTVDGTDKYVATDQVATFTTRDRYHPNYQSRVVLKTGESFIVEESSEKISQLIVKANNS